MSVATKQCTKCGEEFPATLEHFHADKTRLDGLKIYCKMCRRVMRLYPDGIQKQCSRCKLFLPATTEYFNKRSSAIDGLNYYCISCKKAESKKWREDNPEKAKIGKKRYRAENPEKISAANRLYRIKHINELRERDRLYAKQNPERARGNYLRRRAKLKGAQGHHSEADLKLLYLLQEGLCCWCGKPIENRLIIRNKPRSEGFTVDHIIPIQLGGSDYIKNIALACLSCNCSKKDSIVFLQWQPPKMLEHMRAYVLEALKI